MELAEHERARAVDRIDDPRVGTGAGVETVLLAENPVIRIHAADLAADRRLRLAIRDRDRIVAAVLALVLHADRDTKARQDLFAREIGEMHRKLSELTHAATSAESTCAARSR